VSRYQQADRHFTRATEYAERAGAAYFAAETNLAWGQMLIQRRQAGDEHRARALLAAARSAAADGRYPDVERRVTETLQLLG
jgi:tellurite resistance protein